MMIFANFGSLGIFEQFLEVQKTFVQFLESFSGRDMILKNFGKVWGQILIWKSLDTFGLKFNFGEPLGLTWKFFKVKMWFYEIFELKRNFGKFWDWNVILENYWVKMNFLEGFGVEMKFWEIFRGQSSTFGESEGHFRNFMFDFGFL